MGNLIGLQISCDNVLNGFSSCFCGEVNYIRKFNKNLEELRTAMNLLSAKRKDVSRRVQQEERNGLRRLAVVQVWLNNVLAIENEFQEVHTACLVELQRLCFCGICPKNLKSRYRYGRKVFLMLKKIKLYCSEVFEDVTQPDIDMMEERPIPPEIVGQETMLGRAWNHLMDVRTQTMGLYGMGGVGKTTLLDQMNNKFRGANDGFDIVIWIVVSKDKAWDRKSKSQKKTGIHTSMRQMRFVLLLDDIWSKVDLKDIGVPFPTRENKSKVVFTTRSREVCGRMGVDDPMEVKCLGSNEAWDLFQNKIGKITLESHPRIVELARKVAEKCRGLPLALNVIGETMACKRTVQEWQHAVQVLSSYAANFSGMEGEILPILLYSYDDLKEEHAKSCFLYCALFPEDFQINKDKLIDYWICEGFMDTKEHGERAINQGYEVLGSLVHRCLLSEHVENGSYVIMHDVVREMALWISSGRGIHKERCIVQAGVGLCEVPGDEEWKAVRRMSLIQNKIEQISSIPESPELTTLLLQENYKLVNISPGFFLSMRKLVVLDLSWNRSLDSLPEDISNLVSLRYLDLSRTEIKRLPIGLQKLTELLHLNLESMIRLETISGISHLSKLRILKLKDSKMSLDTITVTELQRLKYLEVLTINMITSSLVLKQFLQAPGLVRCIKDIYMAKLEDESFRKLTLPTMPSLSNLMIQSCGMGEIKMEGTTSSWNQFLKTPCFPNLSKVSIQHCNGVKDLTWLLFAPNLTRLKVWFSKELENIISDEKVTSVTEAQTGTIVPFQKLEYMQLLDLPMLNNIFKSPLPFPNLRYISVRNSPQLKKLPLDSKSVVMVEKLAIYYCEKEWIEGIVWEDQATQSRFSATLKPW
ncbi:hypothetical protein N665_0012s0187 [Sinapis alba]|nr:hypothetical protein N665_0012s0187 [Sinapis alba]